MQCQTGVVSNRSASLCLRQRRGRGNDRRSLMSLLRWNGFGGRDCRCSGKTIGCSLLPHSRAKTGSFYTTNPRVKPIAVPCYSSGFEISGALSSVPTRSSSGPTANLGSAKNRPPLKCTDRRPESVDRETEARARCAKAIREWPGFTGSRSFWPHWIIGVISNCPDEQFVCASCSRCWQR